MCTGMLTKQNMAMKDETSEGLRAIEDAIKHTGGITKVTVSGYDQSIWKVKKCLQWIFERREKEERRKGKRKKSMQREKEETGRNGYWGK